MNDKSVLAAMIHIFNPTTIDWMGYNISKKNRLTYHHIKEARAGGQETIENGALITRKAHTELNMIEKLDPDLYAEYNYWFRIINDMQSPPTDEIMMIMQALKKRLAILLSLPDEKFNQLLAKQMNPN